MIATRRSHLQRSIGDEPGTAGGVLSGVNMKETSWITFSMDVLFEGDNACRLSDKQFHNHYNAFNLGGQLETPLPKGDPNIDFLCMLMCVCFENPEYGSYRQELFQACVDQRLRVKMKDPKAFPKVTPEQGYKLDGPEPTPVRGKGDRAPDAMIKKDPDKPPTQDNIERLVEMKFSYRNGSCDEYDEEQQDADERIVGSGNEDKILVLTPKKCGCDPRGLEPGDTRKRSNWPGNYDCEEIEPTEVVQHAPDVGVETVTAAAILGALGLDWVADALGIGEVATAPVIGPATTPIGPPLPPGWVLAPQ